MTLFEQFYDADYERARDRLIPKAVVKANRNFGAQCKDKNEKALERYAKGWSKCFHQEMERLVAEAGIKGKRQDRDEGKIRRHPNDFEDWPSNEQKEAFKRGGR